MTEAIGIRLEEAILKKIQALCKMESLDRSTILRKLILIGYKNMVKKKAAEDYSKGEITISEAAHMAEVSIWDMERFLIEQGFKSSYSLEELKEELKKLE